MKIFISILRFEPGKTLGSEVYLRSLLGALAKIVKNEEIFIAATENGVRWGKNIAPDFRWISRPSAVSVIGKMTFEFRQADKLAKEYNADVAFFPFNIMPKVKTPSVLLVHDLVNEFYARKFPFYNPVYRRAVRSFVRKSIKKPDNIVTISNVIADKLKTSGFVKKNQKIFVAPLSSQPISEKKKPANFICSNKKIILQSGDNLPHKNHITGLRAIETLTKKYPEFAKNIQLVLTGGSINDKKLTDFVREKKIGDKVSFLGRVSDEELEWLINEAELLCFPTLYEGFGLGVIESQMRKKKMVVSDIPVLREVSGEKGVFFEPENPDDLAEKIKEILDGNIYNESLIEQGLNNAESWDWERHAEKVLEVLKITAGKL